jgi:hypothetical protein
MNTLRVSATQLEAFRLWLQPDQEWMTEEALQATIRGEGVPSRAMALGHAFHRILETPETYRVTAGYRCGEFSFADDQIGPVLAAYDRRGVAEVKSTIDVDGFTLVAQADLLVGTMCCEFKTTDSYSFTPDRYADSMQWRVMALVFQPSTVQYTVCSVDDHENTVVDIRWVESFSLYPYAALRDDVRSLLGLFRDYVTVRGLDQFLRERQSIAAA